MPTSLSQVHSYRYQSTTYTVMARYQIDNPEVVEFVSHFDHNSTAGRRTDIRPQLLQPRRQTSLSGGLQPSKDIPSSTFVEESARAPLLGAARRNQR